MKAGRDVRKSSGSGARNRSNRTCEVDYSDSSQKNEVVGVDAKICNGRIFLQSAWLFLRSGTSKGLLDGTTYTYQSKEVLTYLE